MDKPGFNWITPVLNVKNVATSLYHYEQVLGFDVSWRWSDGDASDESPQPSFACVTRGEINIFLCDQGQGQAGAWLCLNVASIAELEAVYLEYQRSGADIAEPAIDYPWGMREMLVRDIDGNVFRIGASIDH